MRQLQSELGVKEFRKNMRAKLLDLLAKQGNDLDGKSLEQLKSVVRPVFGSEFPEFVRSVFSKYNDTIDLINDLYDDLGVDIQRDFSRVAAVEETDYKRLGQYSDDSIEAISRTLKRGFVEKKTSKEIARDLRRVNDTVAYYADTLAKTQVKAYGRVLKEEKARIADVQRFEYVGLVRPTTRPFCLALIGRTFHLKAISQMRNGQLGPVLQYCGGYNCNHDWEPDPFAKKEDETPGEWQEIELGKRVVKVFSPDDLADLKDEFDRNLREKQRKERSK